MNIYIYVFYFVTSPSNETDAAPSLFSPPLFNFMCTLYGQDAFFGPIYAGFLPVALWMGAQMFSPLILTNTHSPPAQVAEQSDRTTPQL